MTIKQVSIESFPLGIETDLYGIRYAEFVVLLVKAMQEQQEMIDGQQATIELLLKRIEALEKE